MRDGPALSRAYSGPMAVVAFRPTTAPQKDAICSQLWGRFWDMLKGIWVLLGKALERFPGHVWEISCYWGCFQTVTGARFVVQQNLKRDRLKTIKSLLHSLTAKCVFLRGAAFTYLEIAYLSGRV